MVEYTVTSADVNRATGCEMTHEEWVYDNLHEAMADYMGLCRDEGRTPAIMRRRSMYRKPMMTIVELCREKDGETEVLESVEFPNEREETPCREHGR